jgi:hypothetical protein
LFALAIDDLEVFSDLHELPLLPFVLSACSLDNLRFFHLRRPDAER